MKGLAVLVPFILLAKNALLAQAGPLPLRINEVLCAGHYVPADTAIGQAPDWIELHNAGDVPLELLGSRIAVDGERHMIDAPLRIEPGAYLLLWCDGHAERGVDHLRFKLPGKGARVELFDKDGRSLIHALDMPDLPPGHSFGRTGDTGPWTMFASPTPGAANGRQGQDPARPRRPEADIPAGIHPLPQLVSLDSDGRDIHYTLDGTTPDAEAMRYAGPVRIDTTLVLRARAFAPGKMASAELCLPFVIGDDTGPAVHLTVAPGDLWNDSTGLHVEGLFANHSRTGALWERNVQATFSGTAAGSWAAANTMAAGLRVSGSGSRGLAKKSFKLYARDGYGSDDMGFRFPGSPMCDEAMLRADATPHAFLRNLLVETIITRHRLAVDVQPSTVWPLYLNGRYWGTYRLMPPKDAQWLRGIAGTDRVDVLEGPALRPLEGDKTDLLAALALLAAGAPVDSIDARIDTESLIDLACLDLFSGRADHDLNVRCWRPWDNTEPGRWRWVVFDMDLWPAADDASLERIATAEAGSAPYLAELLAHPELRERLLARVTALGATAFAPEYLTPLADSLYRAHAAAIVRDHARWATEMEVPDPAQVREELLRFVATRRDHWLDQLARYTHAPTHEVTIDVPPTTDGAVLLNGLRLDSGTHTVRILGRQGHVLEAVPAAGREATGWNGIEGPARLTMGGAAQGARFTPVFRPAGYSSKHLLQQRSEQ